MFSMLLGRVCWLLWMIAFPVAAGADVVDRDVVLVQNARMTLTRADYESALARLVPENLRAEYSSNPQRVSGVLNALLVRKMLAAEAREEGLDRDPMPQGADVDAVLVQRRWARLDAEAEADFDRRIDGFTAKAREDYLVNRQAYVAPEQVDWSWIYVDAAKRGDDAALAIAERVRAELVKGATFASLAPQYSDDPTSVSNGGRMSWASRAEIHPTIAETLFTMKEVGEVSALIRTRTGYHVVRLEGRRPARQLTFDEVKDRLLGNSKKAHVEARRAAKIEAITTDPGLRIDQAAVDALVIPGDPEAVRRALQSLQSPPLNPSPN